MEDMETKSSMGSQIYTSLCVNLLTVSYGASIGWLSPAYELLSSQDSPLASGPITIEESSIVGSAICVGGFIASCCYGWIADKYGRKIALVTCAVPQMVGWILIYFATNPKYLILSRFLHGFAGGGIYVVIPIFITEISEDRIRGRLGTFITFALCLGIQIGYVLGDVMSFTIFPLCLVMFTNAFLAGVIIIHDSPIYLLRKSRFKRAENALKFYRGFSKDVGEMNSKLKLEYDNMTSLIKTTNSDSTGGRITFGDFLTKAARKAMLIGLALICLELLSGVFALLSYASMIFDEAGSSLSPNSSAIIVGGIQIVGVYASTLLVDRAGRKFLLISSSLCCALGMTLFAIYDFLKHQGMDVSDYNWIPLACFSSVVFFANIGVVSLPVVVITEISPLKIKDIVYSISITFSWILEFVLFQFLPIAIQVLDIYIVMLSFASIIMWLSGVQRQIFTTLCANLLSFAYGTSVGWASSNLPLLASNQTVLTDALTKEGSLIFGWLTEQIGRKRSLIVIAIPQIISWTLIVFAQSWLYILVSRFLGGLSGGGLYIVIPLFISEISDDSIRGRLGSVFVMASGAGILFAYICGTFLPFSTLPFIFTPISMLFLIGTMFHPESAHYLIKKEMNREAEKSLKFYRTVKQTSDDGNEFTQQLKAEFESIKSLISQQTISTGVELKDFLTHPAKKVLIIGIGLMFLEQFSGVFALLFFVSTIFEHSGSSLTPNESSIVIGLIQLIGAWCSTIFVDKKGRRFLISFSAFGISSGMFVFALSSYIINQSNEASYLNWIPLLSLSFGLWTANLGVLTLPFLVMSELMTALPNSSSGIKFLESKHSDLESGSLTPGESSFINSMYCVGGLIGSLTYGYVCDKIGCNWALRTIAISQIGSFLFITFSTETQTILFSRVLAGVSTGALFCSAPLFVSEIAEEMMRSMLSAMFMLMGGIGLLLSYIVGAFMRYDLCLWIYIAFPILFLALSTMLKESPYYLLNKNKLEEAKESLMFYRGFISLTGYGAVEFESLQRYVKKESLLREMIGKEDFLSREAMKSILVGIGLVALEQLGGCYFLLFFAASVLERCNATSISPEHATIGIGFLLLLGAFLSIFLVERFERKNLQCFAAFGIATSMIIFGVAAQLMEHGYNSNFLKSIPIFVISMAIFLASLGSFPLTFAIISEIAPSTIRDYILTICTSTSWIFLIVVFNLSSLLTNEFGQGGPMYFFAVNSILGGIFVIFFIPKNM
ncbi:CLUMA_CG017942, isoform A [Clunio marinus]|uniref:CLUMA_CG017942, isoform A n=1 Tax=Clunio marinus TaxID=568069 RepID=A0A1J1IX92_9DIPT|nr:CLUMA_CG017942, isoform A [Clunio marinus]